MTELLTSLILLTLALFLFASPGEHVRLVNYTCAIREAHTRAISPSSGDVRFINRTCAIRESHILAAPLRLPQWSVRRARSHAVCSGWTPSPPLRESFRSSRCGPIGCQGGDPGNVEGRLRRRKAGNTLQAILQ